jgi:hypothetical protein
MRRTASATGSSASMVSVDGHDLAQPGLGGITAGADDPDQDVALGEEAEHAIVLDDQDAGAAAPGHAHGRVSDGLVGVGGDDRGAEASSSDDRADGTLGHNGSPP